MGHGVELLVDVREAVLLRGPVRGGGVQLMFVEARRRGRGLQYLCEVAGAAPAWLPGRVVNKYPELLAEFAELNEEVD